MGTLPRRWLLVPLAAVAFLCLGSPSQAVIIDTLDGTGNTSAPVDDPGWANVSVRGIGTGVYLGNRWVLTASHVGAGSITLTSTLYSLDPSTAVHLTNASEPGKSVNTDLVLYRLTTDPGLPAVSIAASTSSNGTAVTLIGAGRDRNAFQTWTVDTVPDPWTWTPGGATPNAAGYTQLSSRTMRWGTNNISGAAWINAGFGDVNSLRTTFDYSGFYSDESQAAVGDSGGAMFVKNGGSWELAGMILAVDAYSGQPAFTSVYGNNSYMADLSFYRPQIMALIVPEPVLGVATAAGVIGILTVVTGRKRRARRPGSRPANPDAIPV